jgi:hypothetical protein
VFAPVERAGSGAVSVVCGAGTRDKVFYEKGTDKVSGCEIKRAQ